jgi:TatD DNase family protein
MSSWIDSHCHVQLLENNDIENTLKHIQTFMNVGLSLTEYGFLKELKKNYPVYGAIGEHPLNDGMVDEQRFTEILEEGLIDAIGETGFDSKGDAELQKKSFEVHAKLALKYNLPIVLHTREAEALTMQEILKYPKLRGVFHCFTGSVELAKFAIENGWFISFSGIVTFKNAKSLQEIAKIVPRELILIETDSPYLAPAPLRGKENRPEYVVHVGEFLQTLLSIEDFDKLTEQNFYRFLGK